MNNLETGFERDKYINLRLKIIDRSFAVKSGSLDPLAYACGL